jgi:hypothetical protein
MKKLYTVIVYPVTVEIDVPENTQEDELGREIEQMLFEKAEKILQNNTIKPFIHEIKLV